MVVELLKGFGKTDMACLEIDLISFDLVKVISCIDFIIDPPYIQFFGGDHTIENRSGLFDFHPIDHRLCKGRTIKYSNLGWVAFYSQSFR